MKDLVKKIKPILFKECLHSFDNIDSASHVSNDAYEIAFGKIKLRVWSIAPIEKFYELLDCVRIIESLIETIWSSLCDITGSVACVFNQRDVIDDNKTCP